MLLRSFEPPNLPFPASMLSIRIASMLFTCCFEASNLPIFHSRPVCYLYVLPVCYLLAASKLRTTQSSNPGLYGIYMYCQYAIYMLLRSFEPPNLPFPASMLSIRIASMLFTCFEPPNLLFPASMLSICIASMLFPCCFEASNHPIFHSRPVCYLYVLPVCYLLAASKLRTTQSYIPGQYAIYTYCQYAIYMLLRSFEASNHPIFHSRPVCYLYVLPVCYLLAASKLRTTQSYIPGQYAIYTYCQYAIYMMLRSFEPPNLTFLASMLSIRIASMLFTCCFEASNHPIFYSRPVCYLYVLPVCYLHAASKLRTTQSSIPGQYAIYTYFQYAIYMLLRTTKSSIPGQYAIYTYCQYTIYMLLRSFEPPNLPFPASMLSICIASMLLTGCFEASNHPILHSWPVCYLYVLPVCYLHDASKLRTTQSYIPGQYAIYTYCQYAIYMLLRSFEPPNLPFPASMLSIRIFSMLFTCCFEPPNLPFPASMLSIHIASILFTCCFETSNHQIFHSRPVYMYCQYAIYMLYIAIVAVIFIKRKVRPVKAYHSVNKLSIH